MRKKALLVTSVFIVILALVLVTVIGCTPEEKTYSVTLNLGGDSTEVRQLSDLKVAPVAPSKPGYEFEDWYTDAELQNKAVFPMELKSNLTLYAKYLQLFTLTLVSEGSADVTQTVAKLKLAPSVEPREGYLFGGWYLDSGFETAVVYPYTLEADTTFYAKWSSVEESTYTVKFVTNGGTKIADFKGSEIKESPVTTREGYIFAGWYTRSSLSGAAARFPLKITKDTTLYAKWVEDNQTSGEYTYISEYRNNFSSLSEIFGKLPDRHNTAVLDIQTVMETPDGTAYVDMQGNFDVGGQNEFMFRVSVPNLDTGDGTVVKNTTFAIYFIGNDMYMDIGDGLPMIHFSDIKPDYVISFIGGFLVDMNLGDLLDELSGKIGGIDIAGVLVNLLFASPYYTATIKNDTQITLTETYKFEIPINDLVGGISELVGMINIDEIIKESLGVDLKLNLAAIFDWLNANIPQLEVYFYADLSYDETAKETLVDSMTITAEDNAEGGTGEELFSWRLIEADIRPGSEEGLITFPAIEETRDFSLSNLQFDIDLQLYSDEDGLDVAKLVNLFAPDLGLPENTLILQSEFGYRVKANIDLDLNYDNGPEDNNLIALEIYAIDQSGNIIDNDKVPMLLGIYYRQGSLYVSLNSMMPNYWKANNIKVDGINLKGVVSYLVEMVTTAIDEYFGTDWNGHNGSGAQALRLSQSGRDIITIADDETTGGEQVFVSPTIQSLITAVASVVGFQEAVYATDDQIVIEANYKLFNAINQFMKEPLELPIAIDGKLALNFFEEGLESVEITATAGVPDKDAEGNVVKDENGSLVTSDPIDVGLKMHNFMIGFTQNEFMNSEATTLDGYIAEKLSHTTYESNVGALLESVLKGVDLNARAKITFDAGTYAIGKFLEGFGLDVLAGVPLEWKFTQDFVMDVELSIMMSIDRNTRSNSMFAVEVTALDDISVGGMTGMNKGTVMIGIYGFYSQDSSTATWTPHILLDLTNVKIMNITLPKISLEFDFVQTLLDLFDSIKIGDQLISDFDLEFDIMSLLNPDSGSSGSGEASTSALFAESDGTAAGTELSDFGGIIFGLNSEKIYASLTVAAIADLLAKVGVDLGNFDLGAIDLAVNMDITRTEGWTLNASGNFLMPEEENQEQNFVLEAEIGTPQYPLTVGYVRDKLNQTKQRVEAEVDEYTDDLIKAIVDTVGVLSLDITLDMETFDSHIDFTKIINNILISQGKYLDLPIDLYLDDWASVSSVSLKWDLDLETITNSKLLIEFNYGEKSILSIGITGGEIVLDLSGLGLFSFKLTNSSLVNLIMGYVDKMIADIGDLNLSDIINGLLTPEEDLQVDEVAGEIAAGLNLADGDEGDSTTDLIVMILSGVRAENVSLFVDITSETIDHIFKSLLGIGLGFDVNVDLKLDMLNGEIKLGLGLSDVVTLDATLKLQVGALDNEIFIDTTVSDIDTSDGYTMAKTMLDSLDIALSIDVLSNNVDTGGSNKYLRLSVNKLKSQRTLNDVPNTPTVAANALLVTIAKVNSEGDFNDTTSTSNTNSIAYLALDYNIGKMSVYLVKGNISLLDMVINLGVDLDISFDLDLVGTLGELFEGLLADLDKAALEAQGISVNDVSESEPLALADGDATAEEESPFSALFADLDILKLLGGGIDIRLTSTGVFNVDVAFDAYEINKLIDGVMSLIFGPNTILNLAELAPDYFSTNYLAKVNWDRVNNDSQGFWQTLKAQLTPLLKELVGNLVSSALSPLITDALLNNTYEEIHDILMRLLPFPVFNRLNVGLTTLDGTFSNLYIKGYDDNQAVVNDEGTVLSQTTYYESPRTTYYYANTRNSNYKTEIYLFNKSTSVGQEDNTVSGESSAGVVDWGDITLSVNFEPYEYPADNAAAYSMLYNKYFANKTARYQFNTTVQKANVEFSLDDGTVLTSSTMDKLNVGQISKDIPSTTTEPTVVFVNAKAKFGSETKTLRIAVNIYPATEIRSVEPIEVHAYDAIVDEITIHLTSGVSRNIRTEEMTTFTYAASTYTAHDKDVNVTFRNGVTAPMTVHFLDSTVVDIVGSGNEPNTFEIDMYSFTESNRKVDRFTPEYLYIRYADGATSRMYVDQWVVPTETANAIESKAANDTTSVSAPVQALIAQGTEAAQTVDLKVSVKTKTISALGIGSTLDTLEINPYTYFLNVIGYSKDEIIPDVAMAYYYEEASSQSYNEQVNVNIAITADSQGNNFSVDLLRYDLINNYQGTVSLDKSKYGDRKGVDPTSEGYDALEGGFFGWTENIDINIVSNRIVAVYFDEELTEETFTVHPYEFNALTAAQKKAYFPTTAYVKFASNAVFKMPIRWYSWNDNGEAELFVAENYVPEYDSYSEQWMIEIGFVTGEYETNAIANGLTAENLQSRFMQRANVGVFVDGMAIASLNIPGAGEGDDYYEVNPIDVLYLDKAPFPSEIEVTYTDGSTAKIGVYDWVGDENIEVTMDGSDVKEIQVMLTADNLNNYTVRYKVVAEEDPVYAYDELVLDPFGYVTTVKNGQTVNEFKEFGEKLDVKFERSGPTLDDIMPLEDEIYSVTVDSWDLANITLSSGNDGYAIANVRVKTADGYTTQPVRVPVRMKTVAQREDGLLDIKYQYMGYNFIAVLYDTNTGKYFANFADEVELNRMADMNLTITYWCEEDVELYKGEVTDDIADSIVVRDGKNYRKVYTTRSINVSAVFDNMPQTPNDPRTEYYYLDEPADSAANSISSSYEIAISFSDCGGRSYGHMMDGKVCVMGVSPEYGTTTEGN